jgi:hypothetical protein
LNRRSGDQEIFGSRDRICRFRRFPFDEQVEGEIIMRFLSIYKTKETGAPPTQDEMTRMGKLVEDGMKAGSLLAVEGCMPSATGARVRLSKGRLSVTDGPFTESNEVIGGLAILQANSKKEAIELVQRFLKEAGDGECELRQIFEAEQSTRA